jgi:hypothetical protein
MVNIGSCLTIRFDIGNGVDSDENLTANDLLSFIGGIIMSGANWIKKGSLLGTGANIKINCGFKPKKVELFNEDGLASAEKSYTMAAAVAMKRVTDGTLTAAASVCTLEDDGFTIGTDTDINVSGETLHWLAYMAEND